MVRVTPYPKPYPGFPLPLPVPYSRAIGLGLISKDGSSALQCPFCGAGGDMIDRTTSYSDWGNPSLNEYSVRCGRCLEYLGYEAQGSFDGSYVYPDGLEPEEVAA